MDHLKHLAIFFFFAFETATLFEIIPNVVFMLELNQRHFKNSIPYKSFGFLNYFLPDNDKTIIHTVAS